MVTDTAIETPVQADQNRQLIRQTEEQAAPVVEPAAEEPPVAAAAEQVTIAEPEKRGVT